MAALLVLAAALTPGGMALTTAGPFYFAPPPTKECRNLASCEATVGPWVAVPAHGEATFLMGCPTLAGYLIGGTDARASSNSVRVWFDGGLGTPIGHVGTQGAELLFHAVTNNGQVGSFEPILGCISLKQKNKVSTISYLRTAADPGVAPAAPVVLRARSFLLKPFTRQQTSFYPARCLAGTKLLGSWDTLAFETTSPPNASEINAIGVREIVTGRQVRAAIEQLQTSASPPQAEVQYGAMCEP